jgi:YYY domain-containing protein
MTSSRSQISPRLAALLLFIILAAGFALRVWQVNFDQGIGSHPDERSTACFYATSLHLPSSWQQAKDPKQSPLNPLWDVGRQERRSFTYGHFPLYLGTAGGEVLHALAPVAERLALPEATVALMSRANEACDAIAVAGRLVIALLDTLTILFLYFLSVRLYGRAAGLLAAAFYAFCAQAIQLSHFFAMDPAGTTFVVLAVWGSVILLQDRSWRGAIVAGIGAGLAISSKFSALPILAAPVTASALILYVEWRTSRRTDEPADGHAQMVALLGGVLALILAGAAFLLTSPYAVLDGENFIQATLVEQGRMVRGVADFPFTRQYRNTTPYLYFIQQQLAWGMGWPLGLVAAAGTLWALARMVQSLVAMIRGRIPPDDRLGELLLWSWLIPYFLITGAFLAKFNRYMSPVLPFVLAFAAGLIAWLWRWGNRPVADTTSEGDAPETPSRTLAQTISRVVAVLLAIVALVGSILWSLAYVNGVYNREHTWISASRWIYQNAPSGSVILWELWDDPLPKSIPGEPGMDMGTTGLRNTDWSPYEEDTAEKFEILKQKLRESDYVAYSSKRIYDSVDELPARYPMTNLYYEAMADGRLGFEKAAEFTSPPTLFGYSFDDRHADESWSLYDHPQVTVYEKVRDLSDADYDALFDRIWESAKAYDRGPVSPIEPLLALMGLGSLEADAERGLLNRVLSSITDSGGAPPPSPSPDALLLDTPLRELPVVDDYRWNVQASEDPAIALLTWWAVLALLGWLAFPITFAIFRPLRDRGYLLSRLLGWLFAAWLLWLLASFEVAPFTVRNAWISVGVLGVVGALAAWRHRRSLGEFLREKWLLLLVSEGIFAAAYLAFAWVRMQNPDIWQPWFGGEKFMEFAFLNGILRSPWFPPVDPHFAGGFINYYYFGLYLVAWLTKLTGIYAEVAFNLAIPSLFALTVAGSFSVAYSAFGDDRVTLGWRKGIMAALLAPLFVVVIGNLDGFAQVTRMLSNVSSSTFESSLPGIQTLVRAVTGLASAASPAVVLPDFDFWGPSRVIPSTINEFPLWSFLFADLHPHLIGIPFATLFLALVLTLVRDARLDWSREWLYALALLGLFSLVLGTLASVNLWELPTYFGLGLLTLIVSQYIGRGRIHWGVTALTALAFGALALLLFAPFYAHFTTVGAGGIGLVREGDKLGLWLLIWGFLTFMIVSWLWWSAAQPALPWVREQAREGESRGEVVRPGGVERLVSRALGDIDSLPRALHLEQVVGAKPSLGYHLLLSTIPLTLLGVGLAIWWGRSVLALCLIPLTLAFILLWRRGRFADSGTQFVVILAVTGFAILAGTQLIYLKDFLNGSEYYRMNTVFKFFSQVWVLFGIGAAIALPRLWSGWVRRGSTALVWRVLWAVAFFLLLGASLVYPLLGTPARVDQRLVGWRPPVGTLNGLDFMRNGTYSWPDESSVFELSYDWEAIQWLLDNVHGNATIAESSEVDYYRAGGSRVASLTGLSGLRGMHESEQRYGDQVGMRDGLHREFWSTQDVQRMQSLIDELDIDYIYAGQLEQKLHPDAVVRLQELAANGLLDIAFENERTTIHKVVER